jgi:hypothetical protein
MPMSRSPVRVSSTTEPRTTSPTRTSPAAVLAPTFVCARSTEMLPLATLTRRSPATLPTQMSPLAFLTTPVWSSSRRRTSPEPVATSVWPVATSTWTSPVPVFTLTAPAWSTRTSPTPVRRLQSPRRPSQTKVPMPTVPSTCEPAGSSIDTSTEPRVRLSHACARGPFTVRRPSAYSTRVCSTARTSSSLSGRLGRTSTAVAVRSPPASLMSPMGISIDTVIGSGVS